MSHLQKTAFRPGHPRMTEAQRKSALVRAKKSALRHGLAQGRVTIEAALADPVMRKLTLLDIVRLALANDNVNLDTRRPPVPSTNGHTARRLILNVKANPDLMVCHCGTRQLHDVILAVRRDRRYTVAIRERRRNNRLASVDG